MGAWAAPKASSGPCPLHSSTGAPAYPSSTAWRSPQGPLSCWVIFGAVNGSVCLSNDLKCSTAPDPTPMPCAQQPLPGSLPQARRPPGHVSLPALVHSPVCPWPWPLVLDEMVRWNAAPAGVVGVGGRRGEAIPSPSPRVSTASLPGQGVGLGLSLRDSGPGRLDSEGLSACCPNTCGENARGILLAQSRFSP